MLNEGGKVEAAINRHASIIIDTSILFDYLFGTIYKQTTDVEIKSKCKMLGLLFQSFSQKYTTPYVVSEICNLANRESIPDKEHFLVRASALLENLKETGDGILSEVIHHEHFGIVGATDVSGVLSIAKHQDAYLLMEDREASRLANGKRKRIITMGEMRAYYLQNYGNRA